MLLIGLKLPPLPPDHETELILIDVPFNVISLPSAHNVWSGPAIKTGAGINVTVIESSDDGQPKLPTVPTKK